MVSGALVQQRCAPLPHLEFCDLMIRKTQLLQQLVKTMEGAHA